MDAESSLNPWDKPHFIMVYDFFNVLLNLICYILLEIFVLLSAEKEQAIKPWQSVEET